VVQEGVVFAPQETRLPATQVEAVPFWGEQEENREGFEVAKRKAKAPREGAFSLRRIATQQSVWHQNFLMSRIIFEKNTILHELKFLVLVIGSLVIFSSLILALFM